VTKTAIREHLKKNRNPHTIATLTGSKVSEVREIMKTEELAVLPGWGKPSIQKHIIARRSTGAALWPRESLETLLEYRRLHDQGKYTMCQATSPEWVIQYAFPSNPPIKRSAYFYGG
jgi:hypothetical protein